MKKEVLTLRHNIARNQRHYSRTKCLLSSSAIRLFSSSFCSRILKYQSNGSFNIPCPGNSAGILNFWKFLFKSPLPEPKSCSNAPTPWENYQITVELFSSFYCVSEAVYVNMVNYRQHPYMPRDSGHISCKHIKWNIVDGLTITSWVVAKIIFITWIHCRCYTVSCKNT